MRRVSSPVFFKQRPLRISGLASLLEAVVNEPAAGNARLSSLTGLGVTSDEVDGVLPTHLDFLVAMDLLRPSKTEGSRFTQTALGKVVLEQDPYLSQGVTLAVLALVLSEPNRGAHAFDWAVRGHLSRLSPFELRELEEAVTRTAKADGEKALRPKLTVVMSALSNEDTFGRVTPWRKVEDRYVPEPVEELPEDLLWVAAYYFARVWPLVLGDTSEATWEDFSGTVLPGIRAILGVRPRSHAESQLMRLLNREGLASRSSVTTLRVEFRHRGSPEPILERAYE